MRQYREREEEREIVRAIEIRFTPLYMELDALFTYYFGNIIENDLNAAP